MKKKTKKKFVITGIIAALLIIAIIIAFTQTYIGHALIKSKAHFISCSKDKRVFYEVGAEEMAAKVEIFLQKAIDKVEKEQYSTFKKPIKVYVCATQKSVAEYTAAPRNSTGRGAVFHGNIFIGPRAFDFDGLDCHQGTLIHELSHLHIQHHLGIIKTIRAVPVWFQEGLAITISNAGGEPVPDQTALAAMRNGNYFYPDEKGTFLFLKRAKDYGLRHHMFYKQCKLFVSFLRDHYPGSFKQHLQLILNGNSFAESFKKSFGKNSLEMMKEFIASIEK